MSQVIEDVANVAQREEPGVFGCTGFVKDIIDSAFDKLVATFGVVLVLVVRYGLPVVNSVVTKEVEDLVGDFGLSAVANEFVHGSAAAKVVLQGADEFAVRFHGVDVRNQCFNPNKDLGNCGAVVDGRGIGVDGICGNRLTSSMYVERREAGFEVLAEWHVFRGTGPAGSDIECALDGVCRCPCKEWTEQREVRTFRIDFYIVVTI